MATLAQFFNQFSGAKALADAVVIPAAEERSDGYKLRAVPNEDVYFFLKRIDNSRVVKQADPRTRSRDWKLLGGAGIAAACVIGVLPITILILVILGNQLGRGLILRPGITRVLGLTYRT